MRTPTLCLAVFAALIAPAWISPRATASPPKPAAGGDLVTDQDREHWAFQKVHRSSVPTPREKQSAQTPIDAFLLTRLQEKNLAFAAPADKHTLLRRASLDLAGLPPTPDESAAFAADRSQNAFARQVDRLLASPRFGERWGRHWLDVVGYADTVGFDGDANNIIVSEGKWKYRDYVIAAFNTDKPYDRFLTEQIAGDELVNWRRARHFTQEIRDDLIATGYLRTASDHSHEPESNIPLSYYGVLNDTVEMMGSSLFALTVNCARCHSHKFDPIPQRDYYRLTALLTPAYNPHNWKPVFPWKPEIKDRAIPDVSSADETEIERANHSIDRDVADMQTRMSQPKCTPDLKKKLKRRIAERTAQRRRVGRIQALYDVGPAPVTYLLKRGQFETPGPEVEPGFLSVLSDTEQDAVVSQPKETGPDGGHDSGRRAAFAGWLTRPNSRAAGLVARVMVNRIWQHLFGQGLVRTPENFGAQGESPTHTELLEWLAAEFMTNAHWQMKPLIREIMLSAAYQQSSTIAASLTLRSAPPSHSPADNWQAGSLPYERAAKLDPENKLLWRMPTKRLEAEVIRDSILAISGRLDSVMGGPPTRLLARPDGLVVVDESKLNRPADANKRSIYLLSRRAYNLSMLTVFDRPLFAVNCPKRDTSVIPLQSLTMLNDQIVAEESAHFATRVAALAPQTTDGTVKEAFTLALCRQPDNRELARCAQYLRQQSEIFQESGENPHDASKHALTELCHTLLNTSEFLYAE
jgi:hypothetical protein